MGSVSRAIRRTFTVACAVLALSAASVHDWFGVIVWGALFVAYVGRWNHVASKPGNAD